MSCLVQQRSPSRQTTGYPARSHCTSATRRSLAAGKDIGPVVDGCSGLMLMCCAKHQAGHDKRSRSALGVREDELPRNTVAILDPPVAGAKFVLFQGHQDLPLGNKLVPQVLEIRECCLFVAVVQWVEVDHEGEGRGGSKLLPSVDSGQSIPAQGEVRYQ